MVRKKIDNRIRTLVENGVQQHHRTFFVLVGDRGRDQVVNLHYMLSKAQVKARPSVLWCYKKELGFSSNRKKRMRQIKNKIARGLLDPDEDNPFELFISSTNIRYTYYSETHKILGQTFGMLVLQDFEALTPNLLARTVETVEGGGIVVLLLRTMDSLKQLYTMSMDVHSRFRTEAHHDVVARFNERFLLSLGNCQNCLVLDDELNILPLSTHARSIVPVQRGEEEVSEKQAELKNIQASLADTQPIGVLVEQARTLDQAKALLTFVEAVSDKTLRSTVTLTAARGRGKSAALGLSIAAAVAYGYSNIFITAPSPENLGTVFEFVFKGFDALGYEEHLDYDLVQSSNPAFNKAIVRVNIFRQHRQTIQYIQPQDAHMLGQAELLVIDEAAAIPLPLVKKLLGNYLVFMASTINGYEGTGRSLSLKLIKQLRTQSNVQAQNGGAAVEGTAVSASGARVLRELQLEEPIRYGENDPIEKWLNDLLCLDATVSESLPSGGCPHPKLCDLYYISRDTLFSYHKASETFLHRIMALYVASHYKNSPNDLQLMSDAPAHHLFCLLGPVDPNSNALPEVLCVVQVCLEGEISRQTVENSLARGKTASGDLIPWTIAQQFQDNDFASLSGARVVRIATHPAYQKMGYGRRALELLADYYQGNIPSLSEDDGQQYDGLDSVGGASDSDLQHEIIRARKNLPPLLLKLSERRPERLHWLGVSYGMTDELLRFWKKSGYQPVYLRQTQNELTGEHTCIMLRALAAADLDTVAGEDWLDQYVSDFRRRFISLLSYQFQSFAPALALQVLETGGNRIGDPTVTDALTKDELEALFTPHDLKRLDSYARNLLDYHVCMDMLPSIAKTWFLNRVPVTISVLQSAILLGMGLQHKTIDDLEKELSLPANQLLALFNRSMRKFSEHFRGLLEKAIEKSMAPVRAVELEPNDQSLESAMSEAAREAQKELKRKHEELVAGLELQQYEIAGNEDAWDAALSSQNRVSTPSMISVKSGNKDKKQKAPASAPAKSKHQAKRPKHKH